MCYSVWSQSRGAFDSLEGGHEQSELNAERPKHLAPRALGATVDQAAWPAPGNLRKIGSGPTAIGRVATTKSLGSLGDVALPASSTTIALAAVGGYLVWKYFLKKRSRS